MVLPGRHLCWEEVDPWTQERSSSGLKGLGPPLTQQGHAWEACRDRRVGTHRRGAGAWQQHEIQASDPFLAHLGTELRVHEGRGGGHGTFMGRVLSTHEGAG